VCVCLWAASAGAVISGEFGVQKRAEVTVNKLSPLQYHGGPVLHSSVAYAIYWDPVGNYRGDWKELINEYFKHVGSESGSLNDVFALDSQYTDKTGRAANQSVFRGSYTDEDAYPTSGNCGATNEFGCITDGQIRAELQHVIAIGALPGATGTPVYYVLTPPGVTVCTKASGGECSNSTATGSEPPNGMCGYHSAIEPSGSKPVIYAVQPWVAGDAGQELISETPLVTSEPTADVLACQDDAEPLEEPNQIEGPDPWGNFASALADVIVSDLSVEQSNVVADPLLDGWYQEGTEAEQGDMCQWRYGPPPEKTPTVNEFTHAATRTNETIDGQHYFVQWEFNSTGLVSHSTYGCWSGASLVVQYTAPNPVNVGDVVGFDGTESNMTLNAKATGLPANEPFTPAVYTWNFGDGATVSGTGDASVFHAYSSAGTYTATLTVTDSGGNDGSFSQQITVNGTSTPGAGTQAATGSGSSGGSSGGAGSGSGTGSPGTGGGASSPDPVASQSVLSHSLSRTTSSGLVVSYSVNEQATGHFEVLLAASLARRIGLHYPLAKGLPKGTPRQEVIAKALLVTSKGGHSTMKIELGKVTAKRLRRLGKVSLMLRLILRGPGGGSTTVLSKISLSH
jgi:PKD repeat protein